MTEKRFKLAYEKGNEAIFEDLAKYPYPRRMTNREVERKLNEQDEKIQRWKTLYEIKDKEVTARVDALNKVCEYYTSEVLFKSDVDPNKAVKEVINEILNTEVEM